MEEDICKTINQLDLDVKNICAVFFLKMAVFGRSLYRWLSAYGDPTVPDFTEVFNLFCSKHLSTDCMRSQYGFTFRASDMRVG